MFVNRRVLGDVASPASLIEGRRAIFATGTRAPGSISFRDSLCKLVGGDYYFGIFAVP